MASLPSDDGGTPQPRRKKRRASTSLDKSMSVLEGDVGAHTATKRKRQTKKPTKPKTSSKSKSEQPTPKKKYKAKPQSDPKPKKTMCIAKAMRLTSADPKDDKQVALIIAHLRNRKIEADEDFSLEANEFFFIGSDCTGLGTELLAAALSGLWVKPLFGSDIDAGVRDLHHLLHPNAPLLKSDCGQRSPEATPYVDLYVAGPPCQPWSSMGRNMGLDDMKDRGMVFYHVLSYIRSKHPRAFIIENVRGLLDQHKRMFAIILQILRDAGYMVSWEVVNTNDHGIPQSRPRIIIVGVLKSSCAHSFKFPKKLNFRPPIESFLDKSDSDGWAPMLNATGKNNLERARMKLAAQGVDMAKATVLVDLSASSKFSSFRVGGSPCLTASRGKVGGYYITNRRRMTTIQEMGRLQGFPTKMTDTLLQRGAKPSALGHAYGNAMSVNVLMRLIPRVAWAAGLIPDTCMVDDVWKRMKKTKDEYWSKCDMPESVLYKVPVQPTPLGFNFNVPPQGRLPLSRL